MCKWTNNTLLYGIGSNITQINYCNLLDLPTLSNFGVFSNQTYNSNIIYMSKKTITSITPIKEPNTASVYELSRKIDLMMVVVAELSQKISELFLQDISGQHKRG